MQQMLNTIKTVKLTSYQQVAKCKCNVKGEHEHAFQSAIEVMNTNKNTYGSQLNLMINM